MDIKLYNREPMAIALAIQEFKSGLEQDIFCLIINQLKTGWNVSQDLFHTTEVIIFMRHLKETNYARVKEACERLTDRKIRFVDNDKKEFDVIVPFTRARYKKGSLTVTMNGEIMKYFLELSRGYSQYQIKIVISYRSLYTKRMYIILSGKKNLNKGVWKNVEIEFLKRILRATNYELTGNFLQKVINVAMDEMYHNGDIYFEYDLIKKGRKITHLTFTIYDRSDNEVLEADINNEVIEINNLEHKEKVKLMTDLVNEYNFSERQRQHLLKDGELLRKFYEVNKKITEGRIEKVQDKTRYMAVSLGFAD